MQRYAQLDSVECYQEGGKAGLETDDANMQALLFQPSRQRWSHWVHGALSIYKRNTRLSPLNLLYPQVLFCFLTTLDKG